MQCFCTIFTVCIFVNNFCLFAQKRNLEIKADAEVYKEMKKIKAVRLVILGELETCMFVRVELP